MEIEDWSNSSGGMSDSESCFEEIKDEELFYAPDMSKARWIQEMGMAEVIERKGQMMTTMGITRCGKIYCSIEETLFLAEVGALVLVDDKDESLPLKYIYEKVAGGKNGCSWDTFEVYRHLKTLGYIVGRHGIPWSLKSIKSCTVSQECTPDNGEPVQNECEEESVIEVMENLQIKELRPLFDVYLPNRKFRKSSPGNPCFLICLTGGHPPSRAAVEDLEKLCKGIPLRFGHVEHGRVSFFTFNKVELPVLP
ncbi:hypothetical protein Ancab_013844 [Ancistrocladus abbreviatus]